MVGVRGIDNKMVKGSVMLGYLRYIKKNWGTDGLDECQKEVGFDINDLHESRWYTMDFNQQIFTWIDQKKGLHHIERAGNYVVKDLGILAYIVRFASIESIIKRANDTYTDAFNFGRVETEIREKEATIKMIDCVIDHYTCPAWTGALKGMLEVTNTRGTLEKTKCQLKNSPHCEYIMKWE